MSLWNDSFIQNTNEIISRISALIFFELSSGGFLEALWASWGLSIINITNNEAYRKRQKASRKHPESYKKSQGRNPGNILLVFWKKLSFQKDIIKLTDLYWTVSYVVKKFLGSDQHGKNQYEGRIDEHFTW